MKCGNCAGLIEQRGDGDYYHLRTRTIYVNGGRDGAKRHRAQPRRGQFLRRRMMARRVLREGAGERTWPR